MYTAGDLHYCGKEELSYLSQWLSYLFDAGRETPMWSSGVTYAPRVIRSGDGEAKKKKSVLVPVLR